MRRLNKYKTTEAMAIDVMAKGMTGKVYNLAAGDPNIEICEALKKQFFKTDLDATHNYGPSQGDINLRKRLWHNPEEVIIANGAKQLMYESLAVTTKPGDKVLLVGPCWTSYVRICEILGTEYELLVGKEENNYIPDIEDVRKAAKGCVAIVINNPNNPTGAIYGEDYIEALYDIACEEDAWLIADEIYMFLADADKTVMTLRGMNGVIVIDGFSKSLNITGWRLGYAIAEKEVIASMSALQSQLSGPPSTLIQNIVYEAWPAMELTEYDAYRDRIEMLCRIEKFKKHKPDGGFYFYVPIAEKWESSIKLCEYMLKDYSIAITPGDSYGAERTVRISVASTTAEDLAEILDKLKEI